jgi:hypothetical protein
MYDGGTGQFAQAADRFCFGMMEIQLLQTSYCFSVLLVLI